MSGGATAPAVRRTAVLVEPDRRLPETRSTVEPTSISNTRTSPMFPFGPHLARFEVAVNPFGEHACPVRAPNMCKREQFPPPMAAVPWRPPCEKASSPSSSAH